MPKKAAKKPVKKPARKPKAAPRKRPAERISPDDVATLREELVEARAELARIASEENTARRVLEAKISAAESLEARLRAELEAVRVDLRTALADLEIARADSQRAEAKVEQARRDLAELRESEKISAHAADAAREQLVELRQEVERLRAQLVKRADPSSSTAN